MERDCVLMKRLNNITGVNFMINSIKHYAPRVTLSTNDNNKFLENIKQEFERTISWNKYRSEITIQIKKTIIYIIWLTRHLGTLIDCLYFHSKVVMMILKEILLLSITCH